MSTNIETGQKGEKAALRFLKKNGYKILETNWRFSHKEIDIIATDGEMLIIVEVKTRHSDYFGYPEQAVNRRKQHFLIEAANAYILTKNLQQEVRFDIIAIIYENHKQRLFHIKDAFIPGL